MTVTEDECLEFIKRMGCSTVFILNQLPLIPETATTKVLLQDHLKDIDQFLSKAKGEQENV